MERLDLRAVERISGPSWESLRPQFKAIHESIVGASPSASGELTTIYIKYTSAATAGKPFAVGVYPFRAVRQP